MLRRRAFAFLYLGLHFFTHLVTRYLLHRWVEEASALGVQTLFTECGLCAHAFAKALRPGETLTVSTVSAWAARALKGSS